MALPVNINHMEPLTTYSDISPETHVLTVVDIRKALRALSEYAVTLPSIIEVRDSFKLSEEIKKHVVTLPAKEPPYVSYFLGLRITENIEVPDGEAWIKHNDGRLLNVIKF